MAETLTFEQQQAVENRGGKLLVSAAAGSGKTKVLVDRLMGYILDPHNPANIDDFLMITYTKAAASELRGKIAAKLSERVAENPDNKHLRQQLQRIYLAKISTVHGFCGDILRQYAYRLDISSDFRVVEESESLQLQLKALEQALDEAYEKLDPDFRAFADSQGLGRDDRQINEIVLKVYNSARCHLNPKQWLNECCDSMSAAVSDAGQTPWGQYLIEDLREYLALQIDAMRHCVDAAKNASEFEKPATLFESIVTQLQTLGNCRTWDAFVDNRDIDYGRLTFSKKITDLTLAEQLKAVRNACKEGLAKRLRSFTDHSAQLMMDLEKSAAAARGLVDLVTKFSEYYDKLKKNRGLMDFSDLEHKVLDLLLGKQRSGITTVAGEIADQFREILVDEYQDSNEIQDAIFNALTTKRQNCFMVGDVKQSIYQFRLADPSIFVDKYNHYDPAATATDGQGRKVLLSHNFRSSAGVISAVNDVFSLCMTQQVGGLDYGEDEMLREGIPHIPLQELETELYGIDVQQDTYAEEASFVADKIVSLLDGTHFVRDKDCLRPVRAEDIVILLRSPGSVGGEFLYALQARGIRCKTGDSTDLLHTAEIATLRAILQVIYNPLQDIPLVSVLTSPVFGFTSDDLAMLRCTDKSADMYTLLSKAKDEKSQAFMQMLNTLRNAAKINTVTQLLAAVYAKTKLLSTYSAMDDGDVKLANLQTFFQLVSDYEAAGPRDLSRLLEYLDAAEEKGFIGTGSEQNGDGVTIMSIHKSKGLEFPVVFLCGLSRGFNMESAREQVLCHKELGLGLVCFDSKLRVRYPNIGKLAIGKKIMRESLSEELRILYVAMTRARDRLIMTFAERKLQDRLTEIAMRLDMCNPTLLALEADCPGVWVLQTALRRTEAGSFFALCGKPDCSQMSEIPWYIQVVSQSEGDSRTICDEQPAKTIISREIIDSFGSALEFGYNHREATKIPSKLTATQLKGRVLDSEISEGTQEHRAYDFRKAGVAEKITGKAYGNVIHSVLQYISFAACGDLDGIQTEIERMVKEKLISQEQAANIDCEMLARFFATSLGRKLQSSDHVLREFKFSLLDDASKYFGEATGEHILLQGVVDCAIIEDDGITVLDFKTDRVTEDTVEQVAEKYRMQVMAYANALQRIYQMPVKSAKLYFFAINAFADVI